MIVLSRAYASCAWSCRKLSSARVSRKREAMAYFSIESAVALAISLAINVCVVSVFARGFHGDDNDSIGLENAGYYLGRHFGEHMKYIWAVGLLAAGVCVCVCVRTCVRACVLVHVSLCEHACMQ